MTDAMSSKDAPKDNVEHDYSGTLWNNPFKISSQQVFICVLIYSLPKPALRLVLEVGPLVADDAVEAATGDVIEITVCEGQH